YLDEDGIPTDVLFARYIVKDVVTTVRMGGNWRVEAKIIATDPINDLALITLQTQNSLWREFPNQIGYDLDLSWGDWVFLFGFPKGIKQMTGGWVSKAPYRNTLAVDAVVRFGYSGGPVFTISRDKVKLTFIGLIKSVPRSTMDYIAPDGSLPMGYRLTFEDMDKLFVKKEVMVDYGTAYFVAPKAIKDFLNRNVTVIESAGIYLHSKYYGK
ncbi:MAG: serine protease, partial [bacterium]